MRNLEYVQTTATRIKSVTCDCCKKEFTDTMDLQEFVAIHHLCGYNSVFGDGREIDLDFCQDCVEKIFGEYIEPESKQSI